MKAKKPNIVLIMCDQMRGDCLGIAGHPDVKTPYLDTLAAEGTVFENAYAACPSCIPARAALFTGQSQKLHGRVGYEDGIDWNYKDMLPEVLSKNGYHTEAVGKLHVHPPLRRCGFNNLTLHDGYIGYYRSTTRPWIEHQLAHDSYIEALREKEGAKADIGDTGIECNSWTSRPWIYDEMSHPTNWAVSESLSFLQHRDRDLPFFLMLSFVRPHPPWDAPAAYHEMYANKALRAPASGNWNLEAILPDMPKIGQDSLLGTQDKTLQNQGMEGYYACITHMDHQIGRLMKALDQEGTLEDTIIAFVSDHGEMLFDHGLFRKALPYQGSVKIPFFVRIGKNLVAEKQLNSSAALVELRDLAPTLLNFAGVETPKQMDGKDLSTLLYKESAAPREYLHGEHSYGALSNHYIVTQTEKYIWYSQSGKEQYFNLEKDPSEANDLIESATYEKNVQRLRSFLVEELSSREEGYSDGQKLIAGKKPQTILSFLADEKQFSFLHKI